MSGARLDVDVLSLFTQYMRLVGTPSLEPETGPDPRLAGKRVGLVNGSSWVQLWSYYYGRKHLPGVKLVNAGDEAVQLNFMAAHHNHQPCPPVSNIEAFARYARELVELADVDAIMVTCSTMNRSIGRVREAVAGTGVPVTAIDEPMMRVAAERGGVVLVVATHGPTLASTRALLEETADGLGRARPTCVFAQPEEAFRLLGEGDIAGHNRLVADAIRAAQKRERLDSVVLAQLSMSVFSLSHPDPVAEFGVPVYNSGDEGFKHMAEVLRGM